MDEVPVIDLQGDRHEVVQALDEALRLFGFFYVKNHGISYELIQSQFDIAAKLFDLPLSEKQAMPFRSDLDIGYIGSGSQALDPDKKQQVEGDSKENFMMTNNKLVQLTNTNEDPEGESSSKEIDGDNVFEGSQNYRPNVPQHGEIARAYASAAYKLNQRLNDYLFDALKLNKSTRNLLGKDPFLVLKQMKYATTTPSDPSRGKFGAGAHCDWGSFTILATDPTPGLQIYMPDTVTRKGSQWLPVPFKPNCLIINSGDQIAQLTNDHYRSALHRIVIAPLKPNAGHVQGGEPGAVKKARFSTAVFTYFNMQARVGPLPQFLKHEQGGESAKYTKPYPTSQEYFHFKLSESVGGNSS